MLTDTERTNMARAARFAFKSLGIPESDPTWSHIRYRSTATNFTTNVPSTSSSGSAMASMSEKQNKTDGPKRGASSRDAKEKKANPKLDSEIMMKDESLKASKSQSNVKAGGSTHPSSGKSSTANEALIAASRKLPGSGFKTSTGPSLPASPKSSNPRPVVGGTATSLTKATAEAKPVVGVSAQKVKAIRDEAIASDTDRERRRERGLERSMVHRKNVEEGEHSEDSIPLKRKKISRDHQDHAAAAPQKRRKTESGALPAVSNVDGKDGHSRPFNLEKPRQKVTQKGSSPLPPPKMRKYPSPMAPKAAIRSPEKVPTASSSSKPQAPAHTASSKPSKSNTSAKPRRRSPIYTSSEDEAAETRPSRSAAPPKPLPTSSTSNLHSYSSSTHQASSTAHSRPRAVAPRPLPADHASLRARYNASYLEYLGMFQKLCAQKGKIDSLLKNNELRSTGSITDSDGDVELMDQEELASLAAEHRKLHDELETIQHIFTKPQKGLSID
jgi:RNA polymerase II elongation factor ELL